MTPWTQHTRLSYLSLSPRVTFQWTHVHWVSSAYPAISSSVTLFSCPQSIPESGSFPMSHLFISGGQTIGPSTSASGLPMNIQGWFSLGLIGLISLLSKRLSKVFSGTTVQKHQFFGFHPFLWSNSHIHTWLLKKTITLIIQTFVSRVIVLLFNTLSRFVIVILPRSKHLLKICGCSHCLQWFWSPRHCFHIIPIYVSWSDGARCNDLSFLNVEF